MYTWDHKTDEKIIKLHPEIRDKAISFINAIKNKTGLTFRITQGLRTIQEQDELYAQGRTKPGAVVTKAKGGQSPHNYGLALDLCQMINGKASWECDWVKIADIGKELGFAWGGDWKSFKDKPHFEMLFGQKVSDLYNKVLNGNVVEGIYPEI